MALVKAIDARLSLPAMAFLANGELVAFTEAESLTKAPQIVFNDGRLIGMELVDKKGQRWIVWTAERTEPETPPRRWWQIWPFWLESYAVFDLALEKLDSISFAELRQRVCAAYAARARDEDYSEEEIAEQLAELRKARSIAKIAEELGLDGPDGFYD